MGEGPAVRRVAMERESSSGDTRVLHLDHRHGARMGTRIPVQFTIVGLEGETLAKGTATLSDLSRDGARLGKLTMTEGHYPLESHFLLISPVAPDLSSLWVRARPIHIQFPDAGAEIGVTFLKASRGFERLFDEAPMRD